MTQPSERARELSTDEMLKELAIVFPTLWIARRSAYSFYSLGLAGVWAERDNIALMPDGEAILAPAADKASPSTPGQVHEAFAAWLRNRGWAWEHHEGTSFFLLPMSACGEPASAAA